jgi:hypothetical protein
VDIDGGHGRFGSNSVGLVEIEPNRTSIPYYAALSRYGVGRSSDSFVFAFTQLAAAGHSKPRYTFATHLVNSQGYLEAANTLNRQANMTITWYDDQGVELNQSTLALSEKSTVHIPLLEQFPLNSSGSIEVKAEPEAALCFQNTVYQFNSDNSEVIEAQAVRPLNNVVSKLSASYNLYLGMTNWLRLLNVSNSEIDVEIDYGNGECSLNLNLKSKSRTDIPLHELPIAKDTYGSIAIQTSRPGTLSGELVRTKHDSSGQLNMITNLPVR